MSTFYIVPTQGVYVNAYTALYKQRGSISLTTSGLLSRLPVAVLDIAITLLLVGGGKTFALAGSLSATLALSQAFGGPFLARVVERYGSQKVMTPALLIHGVAIGGLITLNEVGAPVWSLFVACAVAGALIGTLGPLIRAHWGTLTRQDATLLHTADSVESVLDEVVMLLGPIVVAFAAAYFSPVWAIGVIGALGVIGGMMYLYLPRLKERSAEEEHYEPESIRGAGVKVLWPLFAMSLFLGVFFATIDLSAIAVSYESNKPELSGVLLASLAAGSLVGGILYGGMKVRLHPAHQLTIGTLLLSVGASALHFSDALLLTGVIAAFTGLVVSPVMIGIKKLVRKYSNPDRLTSAFTLLSSVSVGGFALGGVVGGFVITHFGASSGYLVSASGVALAFLCSLLLLSVPVLMHKKK